MLENVQKDDCVITGCGQRFVSIKVMLTQTGIQLFRSATDVNMNAIPFPNVLKLAFHFAVVPIETSHLSKMIPISQTLIPPSRSQAKALIDCATYQLRGALIGNAMRRHRSERCWT